jgi:hypothetical protein
MSTERTDAVIADATIPTEQATPVSEEPKVEGEAQPVKTEEDIPFPKKAINALSRRDKQIGRLRAEAQQYKAELEKLQAQAQPKENQPKKSDGPQEDQFDNYGDYLKAVARYEARQELAQGQPKQEPVDIQEQVWIAKREEYVGQQATALLETNPEYQQILTENADILDAMPPHVERAFLEAENAPLAFVALANEGKLEELLTMSPTKAAMEIAKAEIRGEAMVKAKKVTNAPTPLSANKGSGQVGKSLDAMSGKELNEWRKS